MSSQPLQLATLYHVLKSEYGLQQWWPADTEFEVMAGAILTQNTAWTNVEKAIVRLKRAGVLSAHSILALPQDKLAGLIRPAGYFNIKAKRLHAFCRWYIDAGGLEKLRHWSSKRLRKALLAVHGVGPETADDMLLYAFQRPVFVIDAYTRRILQRLGLSDGAESYEELRRRFQAQLPVSTREYQEYHALLVQHAKHCCMSRPRCCRCGIRQFCRFDAGVADS